MDYKRLIGSAGTPGVAKIDDRDLTRLQHRPIVKAGTTRVIEDLQPVQTPELGQQCPPTHLAIRLDCSDALEDLLQTISKDVVVAWRVILSFGHYMQKRSGDIDEIRESHLGIASVQLIELQRVLLLLTIAASRVHAQLP